MSWWATEKKKANTCLLYTSPSPFNDHNERIKSKYIIEEAKAGKKISVISDAGAPLISDPGYLLVNECIKENIKYSVIPGPSSVINSLLLSGFAVNKFTFLGFLPRKDSERKKIFLEIIKFGTTKQINFMILTI